MVAENQRGDEDVVLNRNGSGPRGLEDRHRQLAKFGLFLKELRTMEGRFPVVCRTSATAAEVW